MNMKQIIPIFFSVDDKYVPYLATAIVSVIENASLDYEYRFVVLHQSLSKANKEKLNHLIRPGFEIEYADMGKKMTGISDKITNKLRGDYYTMTIYFRLFIPEILFLITEHQETDRNLVLHITMENNLLYAQKTMLCSAFVMIAKTF